jgi:DNA-binding FrmR family transcriptional regulator
MAAQSILKKTNRMVLQAHLECCVRQAVSDGNPGEKLEELSKVLGKLTE